jgi:hypothetical protein
MNLRKTLSDLVRVIADEAERSPEFKDKVLSVFGQNHRAGTVQSPTVRGSSASARRKNRRTAAILDPVELAASGEDILRSRLAALTVDQLQDIVSEYGMDPGRLVVKWKTPERTIDRIVEMAIARAQKGNAFRSDT